MKGAGLALETRNLKLETGFRNLAGQRAIVHRLSGGGSPTMVSDQRNKGESNEIPEAIGCRPGVAHRARPVPAGTGTEQHTVQHHHDDTESTRRSEHHHHDTTGSGIGAAGPGHSEHGYDGYAGRPGSEADRFDDDHNHASAKGNRHHDHHNHASAGN